MHFVVTIAEIRNCAMVCIVRPLFYFETAFHHVIWCWCKNNKCSALNKKKTLVGDGDSSFFVEVYETKISLISIAKGFQLILFNVFSCPAIFGGGGR